MHRPLTIDASRALERELARMLGPDAAVEEASSREWASVTFTGARHKMVVLIEGTGAGATADRFCGQLDAAEFSLRGHIVADIALVEREEVPDGVRLRIEVLTVEDA